MDHGLEDVHTRVTLNKNPCGTITVDIGPGDQELFITITDDGRGLNLNQLYRQGLEAGIFNTAHSVTRLDVANAIFVAGLSTKKALDTLSGRGVGMDAVRQFINDFGGKITLVIHDPELLFSESDEQVGISFSFCIELPKEKSTYSN
jgi:chemotaxis protein histidine kinase CheA